MDEPIIAVFDANILYPAPLRDLFIRNAQTGLVLGIDPDYFLAIPREPSPTEFRAARQKLAKLTATDT